MKKLITIGLIALVCFVSLASLINNRTFSVVQNQNSEVHVQLTHIVEHIYTMTYFNITGAKYYRTVGNATLALQGNGTNPFYYSAGYYVSPAIDLGAYNNYFLTWVNVSYDTLNSSALTGHAQFSEDNITWSGWIELSGLPNVTGGFEIARYAQFYFNLTASANKLVTPHLYSLLIQFEETILNEVPDIENIETTRITAFIYNISCTVIDPDADLLNLTLRNATNDEIINSWDNIENGTASCYPITFTDYATAYVFYFEVTDGENTTSSPNFNITTENNPNHYAEPLDYLVVAICGCVVLSIAVINLSKKRF